MNILGNLFQFGGSILLLGGYIPQIKQLHKTKKSNDISLPFWIILTSGLFCITINMFISKVPILIFLTQFLNALIALWTTILVKKYRH